MHADGQTEKLLRKQENVIDIEAHVLFATEAETNALAEQVRLAKVEGFAYLRAELRSGMDTLSRNIWEGSGCNMRELGVADVSILKDQIVASVKQMYYTGSVQRNYSRACDTEIVEAVVKML